MMEKGEIIWLVHKINVLSLINNFPSLVASPRPAALYLTRFILDVGRRYVAHLGVNYNSSSGWL
jgi:hypothetical protein